MAERPPRSSLPVDKWIQKFLAHLATDRGASIYTQRNYGAALKEFGRWHQEERHAPPAWDKLQRDDFRAYVRFLGRHNLSRAAVQLRFSALRTFYKFLVRHGVVAATPIKNLALPKAQKRLPRFLTAKQMEDLLVAPLKALDLPKGKSAGRPVSVVAGYRDVAILETIYSCGLRVSELCGLEAADIDGSEGIVRVRGKGRKERLVPIGDTALKAIEHYWSLLKQRPAGQSPVFLSETRQAGPVSAVMLARRLKNISLWRASTGSYPA